MSPEEVIASVIKRAEDDAYLHGAWNSRPDVQPADVLEALRSSGYAVIALPEPNQGWGVHPGFMVDESYIVGASPEQVFLEDDDAVTALPPSKARAIAAALLAAANKAEGRA